MALNEKLGSEERCKGGMFTAEKDIGGAGLVALSDSTLTRVRMLDHSSCRYVNFEAEINYPEELGVVQVSHATRCPCCARAQHGPQHLVHTLLVL